MSDSRYNSRKIFPRVTLGILPHFTLTSVGPAMCDRQSTIHIICAMCDRQSTIHIVQRAIDNLQSTLCNVRSTIYNPRCTKCDRQSTIYDVWAAMHAQSRHRKWTSDDCRVIVLVEALQLDSNCMCITSKTPAQEPWALCIYTNKCNTNALQVPAEGF